MCAVCQAAHDGIQLTEEQLAAYNASKEGRRGSVSFLRIPPPDELKDFIPFTLRSLGGGLLRAIGLAKAEETVPESVKTARRKGRGRLFENQDIGIGSMEEIDTQLKPKD